MPDNRAQVEQRAHWIKKKLLKDNLLHKQYTEFMSTEFTQAIHSISSTTCCVIFFFFLGLGFDLVRVLVDRDVGVGGVSEFSSTFVGIVGLEKCGGVEFKSSSLSRASI